MPRSLRIESLDSSHALAALAVTTRAIRRTDGAEYTTAQVEAWLGGMSEGRFRTLLKNTVALGVFEGEELLGFATFLESSDCLDFLYVDPAAWRRGVASLLVEGIEDHARAVGSAEVRVDASLLARPTLERLGYTVVCEYRKEARGQIFDNTWLSKTL